MPSLRDAAQFAIAAIDSGTELQHLIEVIVPLLRAALDEHEAYHINNDKSAAVATGYFYNPDMSQCPVGVKVLLLNPGSAMTVSQYNGKDTFWKGWAPCPKVKT